MTPKDVVTAFWNAMATNDFVAASKWLSPDFQGYWPQSRELITGRDNFAAVNTAYPAAGLWRFDVQSVLAEGDQVVTDVAITDGQMRARAITFHTVADGLITHQREYWPDDFPAPEWRAQWVTVSA
ncbi:nuclear transport factor 2 family protein [Cognatiyoonia sp. IB215446]|uniref:nuclear transport factor 2 family protein n=1 Tax=Cognatiyoonia sp. IB215446 TaxID=3097355 RepID=UPI002A15B15A|nr:nuclear transport factor 2 family protein [Cognatiyoonia sp. IB215446]MDX8349589.1 nuclear transport factor 2 family protein [Cognatiyoonia sp. IB215446]